MRIKHKISLIAMLGLMACSMTMGISASAAAQGTNGSEAQVIQAEQLEIQLGNDLAGVGFQLKTDAGIYPNIITADKNGIVKLEIGGSKSYVLTRVASKPNAAASDSQVSSTTDKSISEKKSITEEPAPGVSTANPSEITSPESSEEISSEGETPGDSDTEIGDIPILHIILFIGGMIAAAGGLVLLRYVQNHRNSSKRYYRYYDDEDEDDDEDDDYDDYEDEPDESEDD